MITEHLVDPHGILDKSTRSDSAKSFILDPILAPDKINLHYTFLDRMVAGGAWVTKMDLELKPSPHFGTSHFLSRRELVVYCLTSTGAVRVGDDLYQLNLGDALYLGLQNANPIFIKNQSEDSQFYFVSCPAHRKTASIIVSHHNVKPTTVGSIEELSLRNIYKMIAYPDVDVCQLQTGITKLQKHQLFNTLPPHTHTRRSEIYFYFGLPGFNTVQHFMGPPNSIESVTMKNNTAILVPPGHVHYGKGTSEYSFIWAMGGENLTYNDMDPVTEYPL